ncbi:MAG: 5-(carboxyamino)imidazole ribonucleotide synthase [Bryobacteraceae bacterium]
MKPVLPGATVGVLGSGQLGRMFAIAARRMGYRVHTFSPDADTPTGQVADLEVIAPYDDLDAVRRFAANVSVVTFEFENVPAPTAQAAAEHAPVRPKGEVLHTTQHRIREKTFLANGGFPLTPFRTIVTSDDLARAVADLGCPAILKTADFGYDGKGQVRVTSPLEAEEAWSSIGRVPAVLEAFIAFEKEVSVVAARGLDGAYADWGVIENRHHQHILDLSIAPADVSDAVALQARELTRAILEALDVVGVLCVEFFVQPGGGLLINELAPRPHNSGHLTVDTSVTSQFEQQLRAVCGLPLGSTELLRPAAMANLLGDIWNPREPNWLAACAHPDVKLHLYGKLAPRPGRKMGHLTALAADPGAALGMVVAARNDLR